MSSTAGHGGAPEVIDWMLREGRRHTRMREFGDEMCRRIVAAGIPLWRAFCGVRTLHPLIAATGYVWYRDEPGASRLIATYETQTKDFYRNSPPIAVQESGEPMRRRLEDPDCPLDYPILEEFKGKGCTDYLALPMPFSNGQINSITWSTDRPGGFSDADVAGLGDIAEMLAVIVELQSSRRISRILLDTYVGHRAGSHVLSGEITRGSGETIEAVVWLSDLRGFTALTDSLAQDALIDLLDDYMEIVCGAVTQAGGEVLKFIGDAVLAIFELDGERDAAFACAAALDAAGAARVATAAKNGERRADGKPAFRYGVALHLGTVMYGNIGAPDRLDFTVIGPAVNHAARLEALGAELGRPLVASASFAAHASDTLERLGAYELKGVSEPQEVFAPIQ